MCQHEYGNRGSSIPTLTEAPRHAADACHREFLQPERGSPGARIRHTSPPQAHVHQDRLPTSHMRCVRRDEDGGMAAGTRTGHLADWGSSRPRSRRGRSSDANWHSAH